MKSKEDKIQWITRTGVLVALLIAVQWGTGWTKAFAGQFITDSCVNCVLVLTALLAGMWTGVTVAILSPFCSFVLGLGPGLLQVVPAIALGNLVLVLLAVVALGRKETRLSEKIFGIAVMAVTKFLVLYCAVVLVLIPAMGPALPAQQEVVLTAMFSWPQLVTALIGSVLAVLILPVLKKAMKH